MKVGRTSRFLQYAANTFDASVSDIFTTLTNGNCVCIPSEAERQNDLAQAIKHMHILSLKDLTLGGEPVSKQNVAKWAYAVTLNNIYGPVECTVWCVINRKLAPYEEENRIGKGIGTITWIVDANDHNKLMPADAAGELLLEGPVLAREYLKDLDKTNGAFITVPEWAREFNSGTGRRFYKTGDLAK
ncbi:MAG: hypothetical protein M1831_004272 [Alyxoria varia]|nr:MAG: hypothetical protein M1831_004272 [Alyxoria varia]